MILLLTSMLIFWLAVYSWCALFVTSPIGALVCWNSARRRGRGAGRAALAGALYWVSCFLPWVYFVYSRDSSDVPSWLAKAGYGVLFVTWLMGPVVGGFFMSWSSEGDPYLGDLWVRVWLWVAAFFNLVALAVSAVCLAARTEKSSDSEYLDLGSVVPFGLAAAGAAMYSPLVIIATIAG